MKNKFPDIDLSEIETPCWIIDEETLEKDGEILASVQKKADCKILLALKGFAMWSTFPLIRKYLAGVCAGSLNEARLGKEEFGKEVHTYSPAFTEKEFPKILQYSDYIIFNSFSQHEKFKPIIKKSRKKIEIGIRVNPEKSVVGHIFGMYDPCHKDSRFGVTLKNFQGKNLEGITGLHFHALCEQNVDALEKVLEAFDEKFEPYIRQVRWVNFGGGHHITRKDYDINRLCSLIENFRKKYPNIKQVYLEPGEAIALNAGVLVSSVLDIVHNKKNIAMLDTSIESHLLDIVILRHEAQPFIPEILGAGKPKQYKYNYTLGGVGCAAGDVIGEYSFPKSLKPGDKLIFLDMAHYTMVKTSTFCGVPLPSILLRDKEGEIKIIKEFGYKDYKERLS